MNESQESMSDFPAKITPAVWRALTQNPAFHALVNAEAFAMAKAMSNAWIEEGNAVRILTDLIAGGILDDRMTMIWRRAIAEEVAAGQLVEGPPGFYHGRADAFKGDGP